MATSLQPLPTVLSGIKPTGIPHLGNYYGMVRGLLGLQGASRTLCMVADFHALTTLRDRDALHAYTLDVAATLLAVGLRADVANSDVLLFRQSEVPRVHELAWYLSCVTGRGTLDRNHTVKAAKENGNQLSVGTYTYPVLMAADILLYGTDVVPVGKDQHQHLQMAQEMATHFNADRGTDVLKVPKAFIAGVDTVPGLDGRKMSKSYGNTLSVVASENEIRAFVKKMVTDSTALADPKDPTKCPVANLYRLVDPTGAPDMDRRYLEGGYGYGHAKTRLTEALVEGFRMERERYRNLRACEGYLYDTLRRGEERARYMADSTLETVRRGFRFS